MNKTTSDWDQLRALYPELASVPAGLRLRAEYVDVSAADTLCRIGDPVQSIFLVVRGEVRLVRRGRNGNEVILQRAQHGFLAEASLFSKTYHCDLVVAKSGRLLRFPAKGFRDALDTNSAFRNTWLARLAREVREVRAQNERLSLHSAEERILHFIESEGSGGSITLSQSRKAWASELGMTHEALYRALRRLQDAGTLQVDGKRISLAD